MQDIWNLQVAHFHVQFFSQFKLGSFSQESLFLLNKFCGLHSIFGRCEISFQKPLCKGVFCPFRPFLHVSFRSILVPFRTNSVLFKSSTVGIADSAKTRLSALWLKNTLRYREGRETLQRFWNPSRDLEEFMPPFQSGVGVLKPKGLVNEKNGSIFSWKVQVPIDTYLADFPFTPRKRVGKPSSLVLLRDLYKPSLYIFTLFGQDPKFVHIYLAFETVARITATFKIFAIICIYVWLFVILIDFGWFTVFGLESTLHFWNLCILGRLW